MYNVKGVILVLVLFILVSCKEKNKQEEVKNSSKQQTLLISNKNTHDMEPDSEKMIVKKFDIKTFNAKNKFGNYEFTNKEGVEVKQRVDYGSISRTIEGYYDYRCYPGSPYMYYSEYDPSGNLVLSVTSFYEVLTGITRSYDSSGNIIKEENRDEGYPFTIVMLIKKMQEDYGLDLLNKENKTVFRFFDDQYLHIPIYKVEQAIDTPELECRIQYLIDANTGKVLYQRNMPLWEDMFEISEPIEVEYLNSLKEGGTKDIGLNVDINIDLTGEDEIAEI